MEMNMHFYEILKDWLTLLVSFITLIILWNGLRTWKIQLKGENIFKLAIEVLRELKLTLYKINDFRNPIYDMGKIITAFEKHEKEKKYNEDTDSKTARRYAENTRWNEIITQYFIYEDKMLRLMILLDNYNFDVINNKNLKDYILEMRKQKFRKEYIDAKRENNENLTKEDRGRIMNENLEINKILYKYTKDEDDVWGIELNNYFREINKKLRKYVK
jgi:hypothetical protein